MVKLELQVKVFLEGISELCRIEGAEWVFEAECSNCSEKSMIRMDGTSLQDLPGSRGQAHYLSKCKLCERLNWVKMVEQSCVVTAEQNESWVKFAVFECRGLNLVRWKENTEHEEFRASSEETGMTFVFSLEDGEYFDVDQVSSQQVSVSEFETRLYKI